MKEFFLTFIPIFVAIDVLGTVPLFLTLTREASLQQRRQLIKQALATALLVAVGVMVAGQNIFKFLGITISDFRVAGGLILLVISIQDILSASEHESKKPADLTQMGVVPLGIPLIIGPAVLTTLFISLDTHGFLFTLASLVFNLAIVYVVFYNSNYIERVLGRNGSAAIGKVSALFLGAIAVMMIRNGILGSGLLSVPAK